MDIDEVTVLAQPHKKTMKTCNKCSKRVKLHVACFKCGNIYHAKCFLKVPAIYVNEKGHIFCCQNITSNYNSFESKLQAQENKSGKPVGKGVNGSDNGLENSRLEQQEDEKDEHLHDAHFEKREILEKLNRDRVDFVCSLCGAKYLKKGFYKRHIKLCEKNYLRLNKPCLQSSGKKDLRTHTNKGSEYQCDYCTYSTPTKTNITQHKCVHPKQYNCDTCEFKTIYKHSLAKHILLKHSNVEKKYKCNDCKFSSHLKHSLKRHMDTHFIEEPYYCTYSTPTKTNITQHKCIRPKQYNCGTCEFKTIYKYSLAKHILLKHSNVEKKYKCNDCKFSSHLKHSLKRHMNTHFIEKPFKCDKCAYATAYKCSLTYHISVKHNSRDKELTCGICGFITVYNGNFHRHMCRHSKQKQFKCNDCKYFTHRRDNFKKHMLVHISKSL